MGEGVGSMTKCFTFHVESGAVIETTCEVFGYPHTDAEGRTMYDNTHFRGWVEAHAALVSNAEAAMELTAGDYERAKGDFQKRTELLAKYAAVAVRVRQLQPPSGDEVSGSAD